MYAISTDSQEIAYTSDIDEVEATSTNDEIFIVPMAVESAVPSGQNRQSGSDPDALRTAHATAQPKKISTSPGADTTPLYSPDGKYLAWRSQARGGFEADKWRLLVQHRQNSSREGDSRGAAAQSVSALRRFFLTSPSERPIHLAPSTID